MTSTDNQQGTHGYIHEKHNKTTDKSQLGMCVCMCTCICVCIYVCVCAATSGALGCKDTQMGNTFCLVSFVTIFYIRPWLLDSLVIF